MAEPLFWISAGLILYSFAGYPLLLKALGALMGRDSRASDQEQPMVTLVLSAFNEEAVIKDKLKNFAALDYPDDKLEFLVVSDGSTDRTDELVASFDDERVRLLVQETNMGKTAALNRAAGEAVGDILVFTDANSMFDPDAVCKLVRHFADDEVGLVGGHTVYESEGGGGGGAYRRYEDTIKVLESRLWGIAGADGAIYALRKSLYEDMRPEYINDFLHPIQAVLRGSRAIQEMAAICREPLDEVGGGELRRQTRIMAQSWIIVGSQLFALVRAGKWGYLWQLFSHKIFRWLTLPLMGLVAVSNLFLLGQGWFYWLALAAQLGFYGAAWWFRNEPGGIRQLPYAFILLHLGAVTGLVQYLRGERYVLWKPRNS